jgi:competence protein ComGC
MIARWNIRVTHAYAGLLWVGGPQVDPGYSGHLFCPIYNLSDKPVTLSRGETLALMDFQRTTTFDKRKTDAELKRYPFPPRRLILQDYDIRDFQSALFTRAGRKIEEFEDSVRMLETRFITFTQISFAMFAIFLTLLTIYTKVGLSMIETSASLFGSMSLALSIMAFLMTGFSYLQYRLVRFMPDRYGPMISKRAMEAQRYLRSSWRFGFVAMLAVCCIVGFAVYRVIDPYYDVIRKADLASSSSGSLQRVKEVETQVGAFSTSQQELITKVRELQSEIDILKAAGSRQSK